MDRVHESLRYHLMQRDRGKRKPPCHMNPACLRTSGSNFARNRCTDRLRNSPLCELGGNVAGELLQDECPKYSYSQCAPDLTTGVNHG